MSILTEEVFKSLYIPFIKQHENPKLYEDKSDAPLCYTETINEKICIGYGYELNARKYNEAVAELTEAGFNLTKMGTGDKNFSQKLYAFRKRFDIELSLTLFFWLIALGDTWA